MSHYDVLGASPDASAEELRRRFVEQARRYHPDRHIGAAPSVRRDAEAKMRRLTEAWAVLGDPARRSGYDLGLGDRPSHGTGTPRPTGTAGAAQPAGPAQRDVRAGRAGGTFAAGGGRATGRDPGLRPGARVQTEERDWRRYAAAGDGADTRRSLPQLALVMSPVLLLAVSVGFMLVGAIVRWRGFWAAALVCGLAAAAAFFMLPICSMTRGGASRRRPGRSTRRSY